MAYEDYMVEEDMSLERSLRDTRMASAEGTNPVIARRAAGVFSGIPVGGFKVQEMLGKAAQLNAMSRDIRREEATEREQIAGREALSSLEAALKEDPGITGVDRAKKIQTWAQSNPGALQYGNVQSFLKTENDVSKMTLSASQDASEQKTLEFKERYRPLYEANEIAKVEADTEKFRSMRQIESIQDAASRSKIMDEGAQRIGMLGLPKEQSDAAFSLMRRWSGDPEKSNLLYGLISAAGAAGQFSSAQTTFNKEMNNIGPMATAAMNMRVRVPVKDENGQVVMQEFSPVDVPDTEEGRAALDLFNQTIKRDMKNDVVFGNYNKLLTDWRQNKKYEQESRDSISSVLADASGLIARAQAGDAVAEEQLADRLYRHNYDARMFNAQAENLAVTQKAHAEAAKEYYEIEGKKVGIQKSIFGMGLAERRFDLAKQGHQLRKEYYKARAQGMKEASAKRMFMEIFKDNPNGMTEELFKKTTDFLDKVEEQYGKNGGQIPLYELDQDEDLNGNQFDGSYSGLIQ
jgi:hypothetical protein